MIGTSERDNKQLSAWETEHLRQWIDYQAREKPTQLVLAVGESPDDPNFERRLEGGAFPLGSDCRSTIDRDFREYAGIIENAFRINAVVHPYLERILNNKIVRRYYATNGQDRIKEVLDTIRDDSRLNERLVTIVCFGRGPFTTVRKVVLPSRRVVMDYLDAPIIAGRWRIMLFPHPTAKNNDWASQAELEEWKAYLRLLATPIDAPSTKKL